VNTRSMVAAPATHRNSPQGARILTDRGERTLTASREGDAFVLRIPVGEPVDAVRPIADLAKEWGVALVSLVAVARKAGILRRLGRQNVVRVSALIAAIDELGERVAQPEAPPSGVTLAGIAAQVRRGGR
jgi:hypothetical protein